jgi:hypothetical protein
VSIYLISGLFALGGVALTGLLSEIRAVRDSRTRESADLASLKRQTYSKALNQVELVASKVARWAEATDEERAERTRAFWDDLVAAYQIKNEIRLMGRTQEPADAMNYVLSIYRAAVENDIRKLPKPREEVADMVSSFRTDLGLSPSWPSRHSETTREPTATSETAVDRSA